MRKVLSNIKGFAMAELLAVSIAVLLIFSILFSNYLPLVVEYENRLSYNDVTAQYAAHYVRKMYKDALEDQTKGPGLKTTLEAGINSPNKFRTVYKKNTVTEMCNHVLASDKEKCNDIIREYGIEEVIITNYQLTGVGYTKSSGKLTNYINYLPEYKKSIYTGADVDENKQLYRIILKTADFGYATTPILSDYVVPATCFVLEYSEELDGFVITGYKGVDEAAGCSEDVVIPGDKVESTTPGTIGKKKIIKAIGNEAFRKTENSKQITAITLSENIVSIGESAFEETKISTVDLKNVTSIGKRAFANTQLTEVSLLPGRTYEDEVFADNGKLTTVDLSSLTDDIKKSDGNLAKSMFANSGNNSSSGITVNIPKDMKNIGEKMFHCAKISSLTFANDSELQTIGLSAFDQNDKYNEYANYNERDISIGNLEIPAKVKTIGQNSFRYLGMTSLTFKKDSAGNTAIEEIENSAFEQKNGQTKVSINDLSIPSTVKNIAGSAFKNLGISSLTFEKNNNQASIEVIGGSAFQNISTPNTCGTNRNQQCGLENLEIPNSIKDDETKEIPYGIGVDTFRNSGIKYLSFQNGVVLKYIAKTSFSSNNIVGSSENEGLKLPETINKIENNAFTSNPLTNGINLEFLTNLEIIDYNAFSNSSLETIKIPSSVLKINNNAFSSSKLKEVIFLNDSKLQTIGAGAFRDNPLKKFTIPSNVTEIREKAFNGCTELGEAEGSFINNSSINPDWCDIFYDINKFSCETSTTGNTLLITPIALADEVAYPKYITNVGGSN